MLSAVYVVKACGCWAGNLRGGDDSDSEKEAKAKSPPSSPGKKGSKPSSPNKGARAGQEEGDGVLVEAEDAADLD